MPVVNIAGVQMYKCCYCGRRFLQMRASIEHKLQEHTERVIEAKIRKELSGGGKLPCERILRCKYCDRLFLGLEAFLRHKITEHVEVVINVTIAYHLARIARGIQLPVPSATAQLVLQKVVELIEVEVSDEECKNEIQLTPPTSHQMPDEIACLQIFSDNADILEAKEAVIEVKEQVAEAEEARNESEPIPSTSHGILPGNACLRIRPEIEADASVLEAEKAVITVKEQVAEAEESGNESEPIPSTSQGILPGNACLRIRPEIEVDASVLEAEKAETVASTEKSGKEVAGRSKRCIYRKWFRVPQRVIPKSSRPIKTGMVKTPNRPGRPKNSAKRPKESTIAPSAPVLGKRERRPTVPFQMWPHGRLAFRSMETASSSSSQPPAPSTSKAAIEADAAELVGRQKSPRSYKLECRYCPKKFEGKTKRIEHENANHLGFKSYLCDVCGYATAWKSEFGQHMRNHATPLPYKCRICGCGYKSTSSRANHQKNCKGSAYRCQLCGRKFKAIAARMNHQTGCKGTNERKPE